MFLKNRNIIFKMKISKVTDYAALIAKSLKYITSPLIVTLLNMMRTVFRISVVTLMSDLGSGS